ncbi:methyl-accepting chemotaxis protein [Qipengyuania sp.]|uniref:methyl-accepting chemotaxis protein n=1 Tax=Qipengyuania sp. TaxID=2004515 RepID=UPI0035C7D3F5
MSLKMLNQDNFLSDQALSSALLEKDFASLERDVFRYALLRNNDTREGFESNVGDLRQAIADARAKIEGADQERVDLVSTLSDSYVETVEAVIAAGPTDAAAVSKIMASGDKVDAAIEAIRDPVIAEAALHSEAQAAFSQKVMWITSAIALLVGLISFILARAIRNAISSELGSISDAIRKVLQGDFNVSINLADRNDDVGELARAAVQLRDTSMQKRQSDAEMAEMAERVGECLQRMSQGDLTMELGELSKTYEGLRTDFNSTIAQLHGTMSGVAEAAHTIRVGSNEISQASDDLASRTERHASELARTTEAVNRITAMLSETANGAAQAQKDVSEAMCEAKSGGEVISQAVAAMAEIENSTAQIEEIISVIDNIAFQTNLLALNAGVEAARAGNSGSGFAVVANEVRALAQRSSDAAKDIKELIERSSTHVSVGAGMVRKTGEVFDRIAKKIEVTTELVGEISSKAEEQSENLKDANKSMSSMDLVTQQNAAMVEESNAAARNLATEADSLASIVSGFVLKGSGNGNVRQMPARATRSSAPAAAVRSTPAPVTAGNLALDTDDWSEF